MVQIAVVIIPPDVAGLPKNRRHPVRDERRDAVFGPAPVSRLAVMRQDHAWVHGRDHNKDAAELAQMGVGIIGCGALGSEVARLLAAAGVGQFVFVDKDRLESANTTRHALGATSVGQWKATALAKAIGQLFPHLAKAVTHHHAFEVLETEALEELACCNVILAAGVDALAIVRIARWRDSLDDPPPLIIAWVEEFACAGHAMLLSPGLTAETFLDDSGRPEVNLTSNWPTALANVVPAGCGSSFQPYTATEMLGTVQTTTRLALDVLLDDAQAPLHRV
ncbi:UBA/THIF-type NAD/FAD binding protein, partial [mine drainage metagenome]